MTAEVLIEIVSALIVGLSLGLLGAGGSILTVPILVYVLHEPAKLAIAESLIIVGCIALAAVVRYAIQRSIDWRMAIVVGAPGMLGSFAGAAVSQLVPTAAQMLLFAAVVLAAAWRMLAVRPVSTSEVFPSRPLWQALLAGLAVGMLTGLVGVGGGFLLVPALVLFLGLPMHTAVPTSLVIIVANSAVGFAKHASALTRDGSGELHWRAIAIFVIVGVIGSLSGTALAPHIPQRILRLAFAWVLVAIGLAIAAHEVHSLLT